MVEHSFEMDAWWKGQEVHGKIALHAELFRATIKIEYRWICASSHFEIGSLRWAWLLWIVRCFVSICCSRNLHLILSPPNVFPAPGRLSRCLLMHDRHSLEPCFWTCINVPASIPWFSGFSNSCPESIPWGELDFEAEGDRMWLTPIIRVQMFCCTSQKLRAESDATLRPAPAVGKIDAILWIRGELTNSMSCIVWRWLCCK